MNIDYLLPRLREIQDWVSTYSKLISYFEVTKNPNETFTCFIGILTEKVFCSSTASTKEDATHLTTIRLALALGWKE